MYAEKTKHVLQRGQIRSAHFTLYDVGDFYAGVKNVCIGKWRWNTLKYVKAPSTACAMFCCESVERLSSSSSHTAKCNEALSRRFCKQNALIYFRHFHFTQRTIN